MLDTTTYLADPNLLFLDPKELVALVLEAHRCSENSTHSLNDDNTTPELIIKSLEAMGLITALKEKNTFCLTEKALPYLSLRMQDGQLITEWCENLVPDLTECATKLVEENSCESARA